METKNTLPQKTSIDYHALADTGPRQPKIPNLRQSAPDLGDKGKKPLRVRSISQTTIQAPKETWPSAKALKRAKSKSFPLEPTPSPLSPRGKTKS